MSVSKRLRPASITTARWWGNQLRGLVARVSKLSVEDGTDESSMRKLGNAKIRMVQRAAEKLTEERVSVFEKSLAAIIDGELDHRPLSVISNNWNRLDEKLLRAAKQADLDLTLSGSGFEVFLPKSYSSTRLTEVHAGLGEGNDDERLQLIRDW